MEEQDIVCKQCKKKVSSDHVWCPHCNTQLKKYEKYKPKKSTNRDKATEKEGCLGRFMGSSGWSFLTKNSRGGGFFPSWWNWFD